MTEKERYDILTAYNNYTSREFSYEELTQLPQGGVLPLAYTSVDYYKDLDCEASIEVHYNIIKSQYENYINGELVLIQPTDLTAFIEDMNNADFDSILHDCIHKGYEIYGDTEE